MVGLVVLRVDRAAMFSYAAAPAVPPYLLNGLELWIEIPVPWIDDVE